MSSIIKNNIYCEKRKLGVKTLSTVLKKKQNIDIIEKYIHKKSKLYEDYDYIYNNILYQIIGDIIDKQNNKQIIVNIKNNFILWNHPTFTEIKNRIKEHDDFIINPFEVEEGVTECKNCGSNRVFTFSKQVRSSDEPMTTFARCVLCNKKWTYSG